MLNQLYYGTGTRIHAPKYISNGHLYIYIYILTVYYVTTVPWCVTTVSVGWGYVQDPWRGKFWRLVLYESWGLKALGRKITNSGLGSTFLTMRRIFFLISLLSDGNPHTNCRLTRFNYIRGKKDNLHPYILPASLGRTNVYYVYE